MRFDLTDVRAWIDAMRAPIDAATAPLARVVPVQIFTDVLPKGLRAEAWTWLTDGPAQWQCQRRTSRRSRQARKWRTTSRHRPDGHRCAGRRRCQGGVIRAGNGERCPLPPAVRADQTAIHRQLGQRDKEVAVLKRWVASCSPERRDNSRIKERLDKLNARRSRLGIMVDMLGRTAPPATAPICSSGRPSPPRRGGARGAP